MKLTRTPLVPAVLLAAGLVFAVRAAGADEEPAAPALPEAAAKALEEFRKVPFGKSLKPMRGDPAPDGWQQGCRAEWELGALGKEHRPALEQLLVDEERFVRALAARSLGGIGDPAATPALIAAMDKEHDLMTRCALVKAIARTGGKGALEAVERHANPSQHKDVQYVLGLARRQLKSKRWDVRSIHDEHVEARSTKIGSAEYGKPAPELALPSAKGPVNDESLPQPIKDELADAYESYAELKEAADKGSKGKTIEEFLEWTLTRWGYVSSHAKKAIELASEGLKD